MQIELNPDGSFMIPDGFRMLSADEWVGEGDMWADRESKEWQNSISWKRIKKAGDGCVGYYGPTGCCYIRRID